MGGTAEFNTLFTIYSIAFPADDDVGGAVASGSVNTFHKKSLWGRIEVDPPNQLLLQQGLETVRTAKILVRQNGAGLSPLVVNERDQIEIAQPTNHPYYMKRWRVVAVQHMATHPSQRRNLIRLTVQRIDLTRTEGIM
jgi:hypothetical protein